MNWLQKLPHTVRTASGMEWSIWRKLPWIAVIGTAAPLVGLGILHATFEGSEGASQLRWLQMVDYFVGAVVIFHWTMVLTVAIGCVVVMVMKGPGYVADGYRVSHRDTPREGRETDDEALEYRSRGL